MAGMSLVQRMKFGTQFSHMAMGGGALPRFKGSTAKVRPLSNKDKRKQRKKGRR